MSAKLYAISDLHLDFKINREALAELPAFPDDGLITGGDLCTSEDHLHDALAVLVPKFKKVFWVPGNHELWSSKNAYGATLDGERKYQALVDVCREMGVATPEDPFLTWQGRDSEYTIALLFIPYDYSFRPDNVTRENAVAWAMESGVLCSDERLIKPEPHADMDSWCAARLEYSRRRLDEAPGPIVAVNHFPFREDLVRVKRIPRFTIWCGTKETEQFHTKYPIEVAVSGHLHMRCTDYRDGVRFEEVSLGYPRDWDQKKGMVYYLREILPGPAEKPKSDGPFWRFF